MMLWQCAKLVGTTALHCCSTMPFDAGKMEEKGAKKCPKGVRYQNTPHIDITGSKKFRNNPEGFLTIF